MRQSIHEPTRNWVTKTANTFQPHPLQHTQQAGLKWTRSSDLHGKSTHHFLLDLSWTHPQQLLITHWSVLSHDQGQSVSSHHIYVLPSALMSVLLIHIRRHPTLAPFPSDTYIRKVLPLLQVVFLCCLSDRVMFTQQQSVKLHREGKDQWKDIEAQLHQF